MRPQAIFINISRGRVVDEAALIEALAQRRIRAAGLDVFEREPLSPDSPLLPAERGGHSPSARPPRKPAKPWPAAR